MGNTKPGIPTKTCTNFGTLDYFRNYIGNCIVFFLHILKNQERDDFEEHIKVKKNHPCAFMDVQSCDARVTWSI